MTIEQQVFEKLRDLPPEKKKGALDFVDFLKEKTGQSSLAVVCVACGRILKFKSRKKILLVAFDGLLIISNAITFGS